ncbi:MAG: hypothetical protein ACYTHN_12140, partial [Planctomycetota bacterium]
MTRPSKRYAVLFVFLLAWIPLEPALGGGGPQNLLVIVNDESQDSLDVANYYRLARNIPGSCFCHLRIKPAHNITKVDYEKKILEPVLEHIEKNGLKGHTRFIVFTMGLPYRIIWNASTKVGITTPTAAGTL